MIKMDKIYTPRILLVDDDDGWFKIVKKSIGDKYTLLYESNGIKGFKRALSDSPDLILCDSVMAGGEYLYTELNKDERTRNIPKIAFTANHLSRYAWNKMGFIDYVPKRGFDKFILLEKFRVWLPDPEPTSIITIGNQKIDISDPFNIPLSVLNKLNFKEEIELMSRLYDRVKEKDGAWIDEQFHKHNTKNLVLCGRKKQSY